MKKQCGAVLAKGWLLGVQFQALLENGLYWELAEQANSVAGRLQDGLLKKGYRMANVTATNQIFPIVPAELLETLNQLCTYEIWSKNSDGTVTVRFVTSFASVAADADALLRALPNAQYK